MNKLQVLGAGRVQASQFAYYSFFIFLMKITENRKNDKRWGLVASMLANLLIFSDFWIKTTENKKNDKGWGLVASRLANLLDFWSYLLKQLKGHPQARQFAQFFKLFKLKLLKNKKIISAGGWSPPG